MRRNNTLNRQLRRRHILTVLIVFALVISLHCTEEGTVTPEEGYYTCSMHPQVIQHEPGVCPICNMKLTFVPASKEKKKESEQKQKHEEMKEKDSHDTRKAEKRDQEQKQFRFSIAENLLRNANVYTVPARKEHFSAESTYAGHVDYDEAPNRLVIINTKYDGWIEKLYVSKEGQRIRKGDRLMGVYSQMVFAAMEEYVTTYQSLKSIYHSQNKSTDELRKDPSLIASKKKLLYLDVPPEQINALEKAGSAERLTYFRSPISGIIVKKNVLQGEYIKPGQELFRIANLSTLWVFIHIFEKDLPFIKKGQRVEIESAAYPGKTFSGRIDLIYPFFDMKTRDAKVRIIVSNRGLLLKPGMYIEVTVQSSLKEKVITIPELAIIYSGEKNYVFVSLGEGDFEIRPVTVLTRSGGKAVISKGLRENELVVANGQFLLDSEASLKEALEKGEMTGHQH